MTEDWPVTPVKFMRLNRIGERTWTPTRAHPDDAGFDLYTSMPTSIGPGEFVDVPTGIAVELPKGTWALITGRSSTLRRRGLLVNQGVIDNGYRGELYAGVQNLTNFRIEVAQGDRIAQLIIMSNMTEVVAMEEAFELSPHERGERGFGSSGR